MTADRPSLGSIRLVPVGAAESGPYALTTGPDDALWFTLNQANAVGRISTAGEVTIHALPTPDAAPVGIAATADAVWFVEIAAGQVGHIGPDGHVHEIALTDREARPHAIVADPGGGCWVSQWGSSAVAHVSPGGEVREVALPASSEPHGLTIGPDGALWVALETGSVARIAI